MMNLLERFYQKLLIKVLRRQKTVLVTVFGLFVTAIFVLTTLGGEFIPSLPEGDFAVETRVLPGSNLNTSIDAVSKASKILLKNFPEVEKVVGKTGSSEVPTDPMPIDASDLMIILKDRSKWTSAKTYPELEEKMTEALTAVPGVKFGFQYPVAMRFNELISGARQDVVCKIFGENLDTLALYAGKLGQISNTVQGTEAIYVESVTGMPQIVVRYDRAAIAQYGLNIGDINRIVNAAFAGESSGIVYEGEKRFDLTVRLATDKRKNLTDIQNLPIATPRGTQIPLSTVANVSIMEGPNQIQRENSQRRIVVGFNIRGRDIQSAVHELQQKVEQQIKLPSGYFIAYGGAFENLEVAKQRLSIAVPISLILIFLLLYFAFGSVKQGLLIYTSIPLSAIGGIFALAIRDIPFSVSAGIGFIALFGVAVLNGIVLAAEFNRLKNEGYTDLKRIVVMGTKIRLRPVLMTAFVASLGFLPMALSQGEGAEVQRPLATVVIGGLLVATFLTLFVLPILYIIFNKGFFAGKKNTVTAVVVLTVLSAANIYAQTPITLQQAIDSASANNLSVKNEKLRTAYRQKLIQTAVDIPATSISGEYGQINSFYSDIKIGLSQTVKFPTIYFSQKKLLSEEWKSDLLNVEIKGAELKRLVSEVFFNLLYLEQKKNLLLKNDSLFAEFLDKANQRFNRGESNLPEKISAENQRGQIALQLSQLEQDIEICRLQFGLLLNTTTAYTPIENQFELPETVTAYSDILTAHPNLEYLKQQQNIAVAITETERSKLLPDITLGYNLTGMKGMGADNIEYNGTPRFHSVQLGLAVPIFTGGQSAKINASKINEQIARNEYELNLKYFEIAFSSAIKQYQKYRSAVLYFENTALKNAETIKNTANKQFSAGEINYLEWLMLTNQALVVQSEYLDAKHNRNNATAEINFYLNK